MSKKLTEEEIRQLAEDHRQQSTSFGGSKEMAEAIKNTIKQATKEE